MLHHYYVAWGKVTPFLLLQIGPPPPFPVLIPSTPYFILSSFHFPIKIIPKRKRNRKKSASFLSANYASFICFATTDFSILLCRGRWQRSEWLRQWRRAARLWRKATCTKTRRISLCWKRLSSSPATASLLTTAKASSSSESTRTAPTPAIPVKSFSWILPEDASSPSVARYASQIVALLNICWIFFFFFGAIDCLLFSAECTVANDSTRFS